MTRKLTRRKAPTRRKAENAGIVGGLSDVSETKNTFRFTFRFPYEDGVSKRTATIYFDKGAYDTPPDLSTMTIE